MLWRYLYDQHNVIFTYHITHTYGKVHVHACELPTQDLRFYRVAKTIGIVLSKDVYVPGYI